MTQDGTKNDYLNLVVLDDPETDTREDPESVMFPWIWLVDMGGTMEHL